MTAILTPEPRLAVPGGSDDHIIGPDSAGHAALLRYAAQAGANASAVADALRLGTARTKVQLDVEGGIRSGLTGTPTFFVNETRYEGSWSLEPFAEYLRGRLRPPT